MFDNFFSFFSLFSGHTHLYNWLLMYEQKNNELKIITIYHWGSRI